MSKENTQSNTPNYSDTEPYPEHKNTVAASLGINGGDGEEVEEKEVIISCENIHKTYLLGIEGVAALRGVSVDVYRGELLVIYGTSGGGKSTLLNVLGTIDVPTKGNLALMTSRITDQSEDGLMARLRCKNIGFVFQSFNLLGTMTAEENVSLPMVIAGDKTASEIKQRARQLLTDVGLGHRLEHIAAHLSGGEQQRVTIARAMANDPDILLMDEPTGDLDSKNTELVLNILLTLNRTKKMTMVMVTHDVYMKQYADRVLYLRDGRVHRIEEIDRKIRNASYENLQQNVVSRFQGMQAERPDSQLKKTVRKRGDYATAAAGKGINSSEKLNRNLLEKLFKVEEADNTIDLRSPDGRSTLSTLMRAQQGGSLSNADEEVEMGVLGVPESSPRERRPQQHPETSGTASTGHQTPLTTSSGGSHSVYTVGHSVHASTGARSGSTGGGGSLPSEQKQDLVHSAFTNYVDGDENTDGNNGGPEEQSVSPAASPTIPLKQPPNGSLTGSRSPASPTGVVVESRSGGGVIRPGYEPPNPNVVGKVEREEEPLPHQPTEAMGEGVDIDLDEI